MIKIDFTQLIRDHDWWGWCFNDYWITMDTGERKHFQFWSYSNWLPQQFWPLPRKHTRNGAYYKPYPRWWMAIFRALKRD